MSFISFREPENALKSYFNYFFNGLKVGQVIAITGSPFLKTGCGKSWTCLKLGEMLDPNFTMDKVIYYPKDFLDVMDRIEADGTPGQVSLIDEGEITAPAHLYHQFSNSAMAYTLSTNRYLRSMSIFALPSFASLDKRVRTLCSHWGYTEKYLDHNGAQVRLKLYAVKTDLFGDKIYFNKIRMYSQPEKRIITFKDFKVGKPSETLTEAYEKKSREFKQNLRKRLIPELKKWEEYQFNSETKTIDEIVQEAGSNPDIMETLKTKSGKIDSELVRDVYPNLKQIEARKVKRLIEKMYNGV